MNGATLVSSPQFLEPRILPTGDVIPYKWVLDFLVYVLLLRDGLPASWGVISELVPYLYL